MSIKEIEGVLYDVKPINSKSLKTRKTMLLKRKEKLESLFKNYELLLNTTHEKLMQVNKDLKQLDELLTRDDLKKAVLG